MTNPTEREANDCPCGCHASPSSSADMKLNGCDYCHEVNHLVTTPMTTQERKTDEWVREFRKRFVDTPYTDNAGLEGERANEALDYLRTKKAEWEREAVEKVIYDVKVAVSYAFEEPEDIVRAHDAIDAILIPPKEQPPTNSEEK